MPANTQELFASQSGYLWYRQWVQLPPGMPFALRYTSPGGCIAIGCRLADGLPANLSGAGNGQFICFTVADDGIGIEPEQASRIFERFCRGKETARDNPSEHSGLGLAIAKEIILAHNGQIGVDTTVSHGCTIHFLLPAIE